MNPMLFMIHVDYLGTQGHYNIVYMSVDTRVITQKSKMRNQKYIHVDYCRIDWVIIISYYKYVLPYAMHQICLMLVS